MATHPNSKIYASGWNAVIDGNRNPRDIDFSLAWLDESIRIVRNHEQLLFVISQQGLPTRVSLDHVLGNDEKSTADVVWYIINGHIDALWNCNTMKEFMVHSLNIPEAAKLLKLWRGFCHEFDIVMDTACRPALR